MWWNPSGLFNFSDGAKVNAKDFNRLYHGFDPVTGEKLTRTAGSKNRSPGLDITLNADKSVSALWALAPPELRAKIERAQEDAAREALELTIARYCATTRHGVNGGHEIVPADIFGALWQHGESRAGDPHLHTHCTLLNLARSHKDGKFRTLLPTSHLSMGQGRGGRLRQPPRLVAPGAPRYPHGALWRHRYPRRRYAESARGKVVKAPGRDENRSRGPWVLAWRRHRAPCRDTAHHPCAEIHRRHRKCASSAGPANPPTSSATRFLQPSSTSSTLKPNSPRNSHRELTTALDQLPQKLTRMEAVFNFTHLIAAVSHTTAHTP